MKRHEARQQAFCLLFEKTFNTESIKDIVENAVDGRSLEIDEYALRLATTVETYMESLDELLQSYSQKWKLIRISRVSISILRLACCEILYFEDIPTSVSINEAVELAKTFAGEEDASFVNGILGAVARDREKVES